MQIERHSVFEHLKRVDALVDERNEAAMVEEHLPFTVRVVRTDEDLLKAVKVRYTAYSRHMPETAEKLSEPEFEDFQDDTVVFLAESKLDGSPLGTVRLQDNSRRPLGMERWASLPDWLKARALVHVSRLAVVRGSAGSLVKMILIKASFQYCEMNKIDWAVVAARPPLDRSYKHLMFSDILPGKTFLPSSLSSNVPHQVMAFEIETGNERWTEANHPLLNFFAYTRHPDIDIGTTERTFSAYRPSVGAQSGETEFRQSAA